MYEHNLMLVVTDDMFVSAFLPLKKMETYELIITLAFL